MITALLIKGFPDDHLPGNKARLMLFSPPTSTTAPWLLLLPSDEDKDDLVEVSPVALSGKTLHCPPLVSGLWSLLLLLARAGLLLIHCE